MNNHLTFVFKVWPYPIQEDSLFLVYWYILILINIFKISRNFASTLHCSLGYPKWKWLLTTIKYALEDQYKTHMINIYEY